MQPVTLAHLARRVLPALGASFLISSTSAQAGKLELISQFQLSQPAEIPAFDADSGFLLVTLPAWASVAVLDISDPARPQLVRTVAFEDLGQTVNSVAAASGLVAAAMSAEPATDPGWVAFFDPSTGERLRSVRVGAMPDMITFSPDGRLLLAACEGEPNAEGLIDPPGILAVIDTDTFEVTLSTLGSDAPSTSVNWLSHPDHVPASMIEPEYIAVSPDSRDAYVVCQENNAIARVDLQTASLTSWHWLGTSPVGEMEALRQPDAIAAFETPAGLRIVTANEGDPRDTWGNDGVAEHNGIEIARSTLGSDAGPVRFGTQGITLYDPELRVLDDSGATIAHRITQHTDEGALPGRIAKILNKRSSKRGAEPEGLAHLRIGSTEHIYVGLERAGLIAHFTCDDPYSTLRLAGLTEIPVPTPDGPLASPEGLVVVPGILGTPPLLAVADEVHGTVTIFSVATQP